MEPKDQEPRILLDALDQYQITMEGHTWSNRPAKAQDLTLASLEEMLKAWRSARPSAELLRMPTFLGRGLRRAACPPGMWSGGTIWEFEPAAEAAHLQPDDLAPEAPAVYDYRGPDKGRYAIPTSGQWIETMNERRYLRFDLPEGEQVPCAWENNVPGCHAWCSSGWFRPGGVSGRFSFPGEAVCETCIGDVNDPTVKRSR